jgi:hypothetical protein
VAAAGVGHVGDEAGKVAEGEGVRVEAVAVDVLGG